MGGVSWLENWVLGFGAEIKGIFASYSAILLAWAEIKGIFASHSVILLAWAEMKGIFALYFAFSPEASAF
ncbi:hypothetical protein R70723_08030 [Paenibacillus sp. FSL R7-0273]|uniref:hypothetical protein n=1 Tax=Paenibacillus sp. FSL R7-0273 TaxID=1536772 RepID=UPI0004F71D1C|nr:hypothetical protein [Paenibacillus sp. FSL R7-0273]AIQ45832.1 hypothetical protein R70723_08030 [Paenibacillus sp. FSL R7-0273]OMF95361.1 hypothetical protein BK144_07545 [Paenibacillus sp. FSL R7-0273]